MPPARARSSSASRVLPMPGSPAISTSRPEPVAGGGERALERLQLGVAADEREAHGHALARAAPERHADRPGLDRLLLPLDGEGRHRLDVEAGRGALQHARRRVDLARGRVRHQPRGEVHGIAHDRVGAAERGADVTAEDAAAVDADPQAEPARLRGDLAQREQHPLLVVADHARRAGGERDLAAVRVDVGLQEADLELVAGGPDVRDELVDRVGDRLEALRGEQRVDAVEAQERGRDHAVLGLRLAAGDVCAHLAREELLDRRLRRADGELGRAGLAALRGGGEQEAGAALGAEPDLGHARGGRGRDRDLARVGPLLHRGHGGRRRAGDDQLAVRRAAGEDQVDLAGVHPLRHPQRDLAGRGLQRAERAQAPAHAEGGAARALDVVGPVEEQQQRVAAELQQAPVVAVGLREQLGEGRAEHVDELLGPLAAALGEALGELREAGDVGEEQRAFEHPCTCLGCLEEVPQDDVRHVCVQVP